MPPPRFTHGYTHDVFISYTHVDNELDAGRRWVSQFETDLRARLTMVSGHSVDIWRDEGKLGAADRVDDTIAAAVRDTAILLVVLSPSYFNSNPCAQERELFNDATQAQGRALVGGKTRVVKVAKFKVGTDRYPKDLQALLEHRFYIEVPSSGACKEFHLSDDAGVQARYFPKVDDVAQEIAGLLSALSTPNAEASKGSIYLAEATSDLEIDRDSLRRRLTQLGYDVEPKSELRLLSPDRMRKFIAETIKKCRMAIHPVGCHYGFVPEGADGKSVVEIQLDLARLDARNGDLTRIIWVPEGIAPAEPRQETFLETLRQNYAGRGFELLERPFRSLASRVEERLQNPEKGNEPGDAASGIYLVCHNADRALAKTIRSFLHNQRHDVEWTPISLGSEELRDSPEHNKLLRRNRAHLVIHGATSETWIQDRIRELNANQTPAATARPQSIYLANPRREDKDDILVRNVSLLEAYSPTTVAHALAPFLEQLAGSGGGT